MPDSKATKDDKIMIASGEGPYVPWEHVCFGSKESLAKFVAGADEQNLSLIVGKPRVLPPGFKRQKATFLDLSPMSGVIEHCLADQVICVESGMSVLELDRFLAKHNQWWPIDLGESDKSVGAILSQGDGGCLEHRFGGPRNLVLGLEVALASGEVIKCGGKVVKNVTGYDLSKLFIGSRGWLGIILSANLRLFARPNLSGTRLWIASDPSILLSAVQTLERSGLPLSSLELVSLSLVSRLVEAGSEVGDIIKRAGKDDGGQAAALFVRTGGIREVVEEVLHEVEKVITVASAFSVPEDEQEQLWSQLSDAAHFTGLRCIEVSVVPPQLVVLFKSWWTQLGQPLWQYRPGRGRLKCYLSEGQDVDQLISALRSYALKDKQSLVVAYDDNAFAYRVERLPDEDDCAQALKKSLKELYDPCGVLNPLVIL